MAGYFTTVDWSTWTPKVTDYRTRQANANNSTSVAASQNDSYVSSSGETCTDGKDDGKIGFFSAAWNAIKGVGKTVVNGVKGMFTDKDGKFSLGKTLLSVGTIALCVAVPAVGVAACAIGGTMGAIQVGKGIYNAATADTDAEAKEAWQNIGGGAFTVAASVVGGKAGVKAMKTAAGNTAKGSALQSLENAGTKLSAKTLGQYGKAFLQDGYRSGKYNLGQIKDTASVLMYKHKYNSASKNLDAMINGKTKYSIDDHIKYESIMDEANTEWLNYSDSAQANAEMIAKAGNAIKHPITSVKGVLNSDAAASAFNAIKHPIQSLKSIPSNLSSGAQAVIKAMQSTDSSYAQLVQQFGFESVAEVLELFGGYTIASENI